MTMSAGVMSGSVALAEDGNAKPKKMDNIKIKEVFLSRSHEWFRGLG